MILRPCLACRFNPAINHGVLRRNDVPPCEKREAMRAKLKGTGVTSATFPCAKRTEGLEPGAVFTLDHLVFYYTADGEQCDVEQIRCVVMKAPRRSDGPLMAWFLDSDGEARQQFGFIRPGAGVRPTGETVPICAECGRPTGTTFRPYEKNGREVKYWWCPTCGNEPTVPEPY
jgi:hypothetical protein